MHVFYVDIIVVSEGNSRLVDSHCIFSCAVCVKRVWCKGLKGCEADVDCVFNTLHLLVVSIAGKNTKKKGEFRVLTNASSYKRNFSVTFYCQWFQSIFTLLEVPLYAVQEAFFVLEALC